ncbi:terminase large subunit domain-containing protein [Streptomyces sp. NPDC056007]|uniref:terminase large subunit domain-containing protein n=1 Tax=Streptomyces sp. NPDC056007 TaxID=3345678 RepID=UPI0035DF4D85
MTGIDDVIARHIPADAPFPSEGYRVANWIEKFCRLTGSFAGRPFRLLGWQRDLLIDAYELRQDAFGRWVRRHRMAVVCIARKNGKSTLAAAIMLYHLIADRADAQRQIIAAANDRNQARMVFDAAKQMVTASPKLSAVCDVQRDVIKFKDSTYRVVSADAGRQQGLNPSAVSLDEYAFSKSADLFDALTLGSAARHQPITWVVSTAGPDPDGPFAKLCEQGERVNSGEATDPTLFYRSWGPRIGEEVDHLDPDVWRACNPSFEILNEEDFRAAAQRSTEASFRIYRLSQFVRGASTWLPHGLWDSLTADDTLSPGDAVVLGFDGSWKGDSTALVAARVHDLRVFVLGHWEAPADDAHWRVPMADVRDALRSALDTYRVRNLVADPYRWEETLDNLEAEGWPVEAFPTNSLKRMVPATQVVYDACRDGRLSHDGDLALSRHIGNAVLREDRHGARVTKEHASSRRKIDLCIAMILAVHGAVMFREENPGLIETAIVATWEDKDGRAINVGSPAFAQYLDDE